MLGTSGINITTHAIVKIKDTSKCIDTYFVRIIIIYVVKPVELSFVGWKKINVICLLGIYQPHQEWSTVIKHRSLALLLFFLKAKTFFFFSPLYL